jgi:hypothetical protein
MAALSSTKLGVHSKITLSGIGQIGTAGAPFTWGAPLHFTRMHRHQRLVVRESRSRNHVDR